RRTPGRFAIASSVVMSRLVTRALESTRRQFAERDVMEYWPDDHSGLILAARITLPHFSVSSAMSLPNSAGDIGIGTPPRSASRALILGSARTALNASF